MQSGNADPAFCLKGLIGQNLVCLQYLFEFPTVTCWLRRLSTANNNEQIDRNRDLIRSDHRLTIRMIEEQLALPNITVRQILTDDLMMRKEKMGHACESKHQEHLGAALCHTAM